MFACGQVSHLRRCCNLLLTPSIDKYPAYDSFVDSVREEAVQNVKRLRHHPSLVIFGTSHFLHIFRNSPIARHIYLAGNNEGTLPCSENSFYS